VIILTVHDEEISRRMAMAAGAAAFLEKRTLGVRLWPTLAMVKGQKLPSPNREQA